jgi:hypothetical protein
MHIGCELQTEVLKKKCQKHGFVFDKLKTSRSPKMVNTELRSKFRGRVTPKNSIFCDFYQKINNPAANFGWGPSQKNFGVKSPQKIPFSVIFIKKLPTPQQILGPPKKIL